MTELENCTISSQTNGSAQVGSLSGRGNITFMAKSYVCKESCEQLYLGKQARGYSDSQRLSGALRGAAVHSPKTELHTSNKSLC